jgi:perosamine synthetase
MIPIYVPEIIESDADYVRRSVASGWVSSLGDYINQFEQEFATYCGTSHALTTANGTVALHLALASYGIGLGDEVIVPDITFVATANAVKYTGATVVTVDIDRFSLCIEPASIEKSITSKTKAIIAVHLYGHPADMRAINSIAKKHNMIVIEDAAEAHGAEIEGKKVGSFGDAAIFSFYGNKILTTGEGGMITTNNKDFYEKARFLRDHAMSNDKRYWHSEIGFNYRLTNMQAALGVSQLSRINEILRKKRNIYKYYMRELKDYKQIILNREKSGYKSVFWMICLENPKWDINSRDVFMKKLYSRGVDSRPYFYPISLLPPYVGIDSVAPNARAIYSTGINLPSSPNLSEAQIVYICDQIKALIDENRD